MRGLRLGLSLTGGRAAALLDPATISPAAWWDPSDLTTMWQDSLKATPAAVDSPVGYLADKSGNAKHLVQGTAGKRPILRKSGALYWLEFDGVDDALNTATAIGLPASGDAYISLQTTDTTYLLFHDANSATTFMGVAKSGDSGATNLGVGSPTTLVNGAAPAGSTRNDLYNSLSSASAKVFEADAATLNTIDELKFGDYATFEFAGKFYGSLITTSSATNRAAIRTYLGAKAGITL